MGPQRRSLVRRFWQPVVLLLCGCVLLKILLRPLPQGKVAAEESKAAADEQLESVLLLRETAQELREIRRELEQSADRLVSNAVERHEEIPVKVPVTEPEVTPAPTHQRVRVLSVARRKKSDCRRWAEAGECDANRNYMMVHCLQECLATPPPPPDPPAEERQALLEKNKKMLKDPAQECLYFYGVGMQDPGGGGAFRLHWKTMNGRPTWRRARVPVHGGERLLYSDDHGRWVTCNSEVEARRSQGSLLSAAPADSPMDVEHWMYADKGKWFNTSGVQLKVHKLKGCPDRPHVTLPPELLAVLPKEVNAKKGVDYFADYDIPGPGADDERYRYGPNPAFRYPGDVTHDGAVHIPFQILSHRPKVFFFPRFLTDEECDAVIRDGTPGLHRSTVGQDDGVGKISVTSTRTSRNAWLSEDSRAARTVMERTLAASGFLAGGHEQLQVLRYLEGQEYTLHHDYMDMHPKTLENRVLTAYFYLSSIEGDGGYTNWPRAGGRDRNFTSCKTGLRTRPKKGAAVFFYDLRPDLSGDDWSLHAACPVPPGEVKWGGTFWVHAPLEPSLQYMSRDDLEYYRSTR